MPTRTHKTEPRQCLILQALYFESLRRATNLTEQESERLRGDLQYAKAEHHFWELGLGGRPPQIPCMLYRPADVARTLSVINVKSPGEQLPDKPSGGARDLLGYYSLHDSKALLLAIDPSAHLSDILSAVRKEIEAIKKRVGKTRSSGGGRKHSIHRMIEALMAYQDHQSRRNPLSPHKLGALARTFRPIPIDRKGKAEEYFTHEDRGYKLLQQAKHMIDTARKGRSAWVAAFPCVNEEPLS